MNHYKQFVAFFAHFFHLVETELKPLRLALVKPQIVFGEIRAAGTRPPARTANYNVFKFNAIILKKVKTFVRSVAPEFCNSVPPIIVVAADKHFFAGKTGKRPQVVKPFFDVGAPAYIAAD